MEKETEGNPWIVKNLQDFQSYKCPECEFVSEDQSEFIEHASDFHDLEESELIMEISKYRLFNCVECEYKNGSKMEFFKHVINNHEKSESLVNSLNVRSGTRAQCGKMLKKIYLIKFRLRNLKLFFAFYLFSRTLMII